MEIAVTLLITALAIVVLIFSRQLFSLLTLLRKGAKLPTKWSHPIFGHFFDFAKPPNRILETFTKLMNVNEPLFAVWFVLPVLILRKPEHMEIILGSTKHIKKDVHYKLLEPWLGTGLLTSSGSKWHSRRKLLTPAFHFKILENFVDVFSDQSRILVKKLEKEIKSENFNIVPYISMCTLDIICETAMGVEMNAQEHGEHSEYVSNVNKITSETIRRSTYPWLFPDFIYFRTPSGKRFKQNIQKLHTFTMEVIQKRKRLYKYEPQGTNIQSENDTVMGIKKKLSFLDLLLESSNNGSILKDEDIREEVDTFMFEGHDTTSAGISWTLQILASHPDIQKQACDELDNIFGGSDRSPTMEDLNSMKYLERVIKESLRLYPSVPVIGRHIEEDVVIDGHVIPGGINAVLFIYFTHRDPEHFPDPDKFNPDNFLPERVAARHPYAYIPFSAGPRNCIGQKFALLEEKTVISYVLRHYNLESIHDLPIPVPDLVLRPENGIRLKITKR